MMRGVAELSSMAEVCKGEVARRSLEVAGFAWLGYGGIIVSQRGLCVEFLRDHANAFPNSKARQTRSTHLQVQTRPHISRPATARPFYCFGDRWNLSRFPCSAGINATALEYTKESDLCSPFSVLRRGWGLTGLPYGIRDCWRLQTWKVCSPLF